ncbi:zinc finger protein 236 [Hyalella azteca]|uniref:Zinc finger protein 236 n=1 Tax=Hyalella azteca TaxID=294128 RepID=A0A8B7N9C6_HYAAZ|nr:zinc finger protein 236 [Hyalella azteca]
MLEYIVLLGVVALITLALFCLTEAGTKETSFEEALAEQRLLHKDGSNAKNKKPKTTKKVRPSRPRASQATEGGAPTRSTSTGHDSPGTTTEDENHEELLLAEQRRHQELKRLQAEEQRRQAELQEQQKKLEEAAQLEKQKQLQLEQQEQLKKQQVEQQLKEMAEQEAKKNEKKKKQMKPDDSKAKQTRPSKATGLMNGVHTEVRAALYPPRFLPASVQTILRTLEEAQLSREQLQQVVDILLAAAADGCWSDARKGPSVSVNKKLDDAYATIGLMQEAQSALTVTISDLRTELNSERSQSVQLRHAMDAANAEQQLQLQATRMGNIFSNAVVTVTCDICKATLSSRSALQRHIRTHHREERPFRCHFCESAFKRKDYLDEHIIRHTKHP